MTANTTIELFSEYFKTRELEWYVENTLPLSLQNIKSKKQTTPDVQSIIKTSQDQAQYID